MNTGDVVMLVAIAVALAVVAGVVQAAIAAVLETCGGPVVPHQFPSTTGEYVDCTISALAATSTGSQPAPATLRVVRVVRRRRMPQ